MLGARIDQLNASNIQNLLASGVSEDYDLDFKAGLYGRADSDKRDLAGDVAALANTAGGIIVLGVTEDDQARASTLSPVEISDAETGRMLQVIATNTAPMPHIDVVPVPDLAASVGGRVIGWYVLAVPRSPTSPHAVLINQGLRYPKRNGATIRYLSEAEVAAAYLDRTAGLAQQSQRIEDVERDAIKRLDRAGKPWLVVSLVPDLPGSIDINRETLTRFQSSIVSQPAHDIAGSLFGATFRDASVGRRRLMADDATDAGGSPRRVAVEYHSDGSGAYSLALVDLWATQRALQQAAGAAHRANQLVDDESLVIGTLTAIHRLAEQARDVAATGGNALLRVQVVPALGTGVEVELGHERRQFADSYSVRSAWEGVLTATTVASLDDAVTPGPALVAIAARLLSEISQAFGVPELSQVTLAGEIRLPYWSRDIQKEVEAWGVAFGVTLLRDTIEE